MPSCCICKVKGSGKVFGCDKCKKLYCDVCGSIAPSEVRCLELKKRTLLFHCNACLTAGEKSCDLADLIDAKMQEALRELNSMFEGFKTEFLQMATNKLSGVSVSAEPPEGTYASVLSKQSQRSVMIKPKDGAQKNSKTKLDVVHGVDPVGSQIKINSVKQIRNGGLIVSCEGSAHADKFIQLAGEKLSTGYDVHPLKKILPRIRVAGMSEELSSEVLRDYILKQNEDMFAESSECKILKLSSIKNKSDLYQATVQLDCLSYEKILKSGYILVGLDVCRVYDAVEISRCFRCNGYNHTSHSCKRDLSCPRCGSNHGVKSCTVADSDLCCINCKQVNTKSGKSFDTKHAVWDSQSCSAYKQMIVKLKSDLFGSQ